MPSSQRPFFLSSFLAAFRPQAPPSALSASSQANKHASQSTSGSTTYNSTPSSSSTPSAARSISNNSHSHAHSHSNSHSHSASASTSPTPQRTSSTSVMNQIPLHSPRSHPHQGMPIPGSGGRRRGSDSSSEGFRDVLGAEKWYIGGRTAGGEEKFFKLGVVKRVRSQDRLSLDRLSL
ncbi:hypothetical protein F4809DRAFT_239184 [Biscogniauxia mediterranea]|nr:hypothetical protein F4809DRAFT_239184 [Biscogniauxia mediterranea]